MGEFITSLKENKKYMFATIFVVVVLFAGGIHYAFSSGQSEAAIREGKIAVEAQELKEMMEANSGSIEKLLLQIAELQDCNSQMNAEIVAHTIEYFPGCIKNSTGSLTTVDVFTNSGTEATPTPVKEEKPQA